MRDSCMSRGVRGNSVALHAHSFKRAPLRGSCWSQAPAPTKLRRLPVPSFAWHQPHAAGYRIGQECELEQPV